MSQPPVSLEERYAAIVAALLSNPDVTVGAAGQQGFGSAALQTRGKIFAMISSRGRFVVKLPRLRVEALIASGDGERFDPGRGRLMQEGLAAAPTSAAE